MERGLGGEERVTASEGGMVNWGVPISYLIPRQPPLTHSPPHSRAGSSHCGLASSGEGQGPRGERGPTSCSQTCRVSVPPAAVDPSPHERQARARWAASGRILATELLKPPSPFWEHGTRCRIKVEPQTFSVCVLRQLSARCRERPGQDPFGIFRAAPAGCLP